MPISYLYINGVEGNQYIVEKYPNLKMALSKVLIFAALCFVVQAANLKADEDKKLTCYCAGCVSIKGSCGINPKEGFAIDSNKCPSFKSQLQMLGLQLPEPKAQPDSCLYLNINTDSIENLDIDAQAKLATVIEKSEGDNICNIVKQSKLGDCRVCQDNNCNSSATASVSFAVLLVCAFLKFLS